MTKNHSDKTQWDDRHHDQRPEERLKHKSQCQENQPNRNHQNVAEPDQKFALFLGLAFKGNLHAKIPL